MQVYLDHHATTPLDPRVLEAMLPYFKEEFGNPSSASHPWGWRAREAVEAARAHVAKLIGATAREVIFTSGATEANNLAIFGSVARAGRKVHIISQAIEHHAILEPLHELEKAGHRVTLLTPRRDGFLDPERVRDAISDDTFLVSVMAAQNEVGTIEPIAEIGRICRERGILFHTDAAQAVGKLPIDVEAMNVDLLSISAHKLYGPKGTGALYVQRRQRAKPISIAPLIYGGGQENGLRPGTLNVPGIVGLGEACRIAREELPEEIERIARLRDRLWQGIRAACPDAVLHGPDDFAARLPGNLSIGFPGIDGTALLISLRDIAASSGSACTAGHSEPSYVLKALNVPRDLAAATLRLCVGRFQTEEEVDFAAARITGVVEALSLKAR